MKAAKTSATKKKKCTADSTAPMAACKSDLDACTKTAAKGASALVAGATMLAAAALF